MKFVYFKSAVSFILVLVLLLAFINLLNNENINMQTVIKKAKM